MTANYNFEQEKKAIVDNILDTKSAENQTVLVKGIIKSKVFRKSELNLLSMLFPVKPLWKFLEFKVDNSQHIRGKQRDKLITALESTNSKIAENSLFHKLFSMRSNQPSY